MKQINWFLCLRSRLGLMTMLTLLLLGCQSGGPRQKDVVDPSQRAQPQTLEDILSEKSTKPLDIVNWLKSCEKKCLQPDAEIAGDLAAGYDTLFSIAAKNPRYEKLNQQERKRALQAQNQVRKGFIKILKFKNGRDILQTALLELANPTSLYAAQDQEVADLILATIERLKNQPETRATGFYFQAISIPQVVENTKLIIESYQQCYLISGRTDQQCLDAYNDVVQFFERPRCRERNFSQGTSFAASGNEQNPILTEADILESSLEVIGPAAATTRPRYEIWFNLKTFSSEKLEKFTAENSQKNVHFLLQFQKRTLSKAKVLSKISDGQFRMPFPTETDARLAFDQICRKQTPEQVPAQLKIK